MIILAALAEGYAERTADPDTAHVIQLIMELQNTCSASGYEAVRLLSLSRHSFVFYHPVCRLLVFLAPETWTAHFRKCTLTSDPNVLN